MSDLFALDERGANELEQRALENVHQGFDAEPSAWRGTGASLGLSIPRAFAGLGNTIDDLSWLMADDVNYKAHKAGVIAENTLFPKNSYMYSFANADLKDVYNYYKPDPITTGKAAHIVGGVTEGAAQLALSLGNPGPMAASQYTATKQDLISQGVDEGTANKVGLVSGAATLVGAKIPALGKTIATQIGTGVAGNIAIGSATRKAQKEILEYNGYDQQAKSFNTDALALSVDTLTGLLFSGSHYLFNPKLRPSERDALMTLKSAKNFKDNGEIKPLNDEAAAAHDDALSSALDSIAERRPVQVDSIIADHPNAEFSKYPTITEKFEAELQDHQAAVERYNALDDSAGGKILNVDTARELSADYLSDRTLSADVHEPASAFIKKLYAEKLKETPKPGEDPLVLFSAGGTGAGKSTGLASLPEETARAQIVYDTNMNNLKSSVKKIEQALEAGKDVSVVYTYREPIEALRNGALPRAMRQEGNYGSGRTVPVDKHVDTHIGSRDVIEKLAEKYKDDPRVSIHAIDNSRGKGNAKIVKLSELPKIGKEEYTKLHEDAIKTIQEELAAGRISSEIAKGFGAPEASRPNGAGDSAKPEQSVTLADLQKESVLPSENLATKLADTHASDIPEVAALQDFSNQDKQISLGSNADGEITHTTVKEALDSIEREYQSDIDAAKAYEVAVNCFLGA